MNPYDPCVANADIDNSQCTIAWYVDDLKVSHADPTVVDNIINHLENKFGKMTVKRGKRHEYLGMDITYNDDGTASILMSSYIDDAASSFGETLNGTAPTPAKKNSLT